MERKFKTLIKGVEVDLIPYIKDFVAKNPDTELLIGCDSQNRTFETYYAIVIGLYKPQKGAHVLYNRSIEKRHFTGEPEEIETTRLLNEVWYSIEVAEYIKNELGIIAKWIDIDLNPDPKYGSNKVLSQAVGLVKGMGYNVRHKHESPMMTYAADNLVK